MKIANTIPTALFFAPATTRDGEWSNLRPVTRRARSLRQALENDASVSRRQEVIASAMLLLCLLFSLAVCIGQFIAA